MSYQPLIDSNRLKAGFEQIAERENVRDFEKEKYYEIVKVWKENFLKKVSSQFFSFLGILTLRKFNANSEIEKFCKTPTLYNYYYCAVICLQKIRQFVRIFPTSANYVSQRSTHIVRDTDIDCETSIKVNFISRIFIAVETR